MYILIYNFLNSHYYLFDLHKNSVTRAKQGLLFPFKQEKTAGQTR